MTDGVEDPLDFGSRRRRFRRLVRRPSDQSKAGRRRRRRRKPPACRDVTEDLVAADDAQHVLGVVSDADDDDDVGSMAPRQRHWLAQKSAVSVCLRVCVCVLIISSRSVFDRRPMKD